MCRAAGYRVSSLLDFAPGNRLRRPASVLAFKRSEDLDRVEAKNPSVRILCPRGGFQDLMGDKTLFPRLLEDSHVPVIPSLTVAPASLAAASQIWDLFRSERLVVQKRQNDLIGKGTFLADSSRRLEALFQQHAGKILKVSPFVSGELITISGCALREGSVASYFSRQLVGIPGLTSCWGTHCGNDVLPDSEVAPQVVSEVRDMTVTIGDILADSGFEGVFGLDLIVDDRDRAHVVELNPRLQSVSSIVTATEVERGEFPILAHHILAYHGIYHAKGGDEERPAPVSGPFSQLVLCNLGTEQKIVRTVRSGSYRQLEDGSLVLLKEAADLADLCEGDFLVVLRVVGGEIAAKGQRIFDLQRRGPMTDRDRLLPEVKTCLGYLASRLGIDPGWKECFGGYENRDE